MTVALKLKKLAAIISIGMMVVANASADTLDLSLPESRFYAREQKSFLVASNEAETSKEVANISGVAPTAEFEPKIFSGSRAHQYLGVGTALLAGASFITHPHPADPNAPRETNGTHAQLAKATVVMAVAAIAAGVLSHWNDFSVEDGWSDPDNLHVLLGMTGVALMAYAVDKSANSDTPVEHARVAELGALGMVVAIKLTW